VSNPRKRHLIDWEIITSHEPIDVVLTEIMFHGGISTLLRRWFIDRNLRVITYAKGDGFDSISATRYAAMRQLARVVHTNVYRYADHHIYASKWIRDRYWSKLPFTATQPTSVIPHAPDPVYYTIPLGRKNGLLRLLYVGNFEVLDKTKGVELLVAVAQYLHLSGVKVQFDVCADGPCFRDVVSRFSGIPYVVFNRWVPGDALIQAYRNSDLLIYHSLTDACPTVVMEAQAAGLPVVCTPNTGAAELIDPGQSGYVVEDNVAAMAGVIENLITNPIQLNRMSAHAREYALRNFTWDISAERIHKVLGG